MATHPILAWQMPWTEEPGGLQSLESQSQTRLSTSTDNTTYIHCGKHRKFRYTKEHIYSQSHHLTISYKFIIFLSQFYVWKRERDTEIFHNPCEFLKTLHFFLALQLGEEATKEKSEQWNLSKDTESIFKGFVVRS